MRSLFLVVAAVLLCGMTPALEQPQELKIPGLADQEQGALVLVSRVYPVGWSPEALFAYVYEPADEACGCYFFELIVQDLKSDRVAWRFEYSSDAFAPGGPGHFENLSEIWQAKHAEFAAKLRELGIAGHHQPAPIPFAGGPEKLKAKVSTETKGDDVEVFVHLSKYTVELNGPKGRKTIFRSDKAGVTSDTFGPLQAAANGYLRSPYDKRIAVLIEEKWRGWEGPPNVIRLRFAGADLERGFR